MRFARRTSISLLLALSLGCGERASTPEVSPFVAKVFGPHNGPAVALPGDRGYAEVLAEPGRAGQDPSLVVYFLDPDLKRVLSPLPSDVRVKLTIAGGESEELPLSPAPKPRDKTGSGRMASPPVSVDPDRVSGELSATVEGQPFTVAFAIGH